MNTAFKFFVRALLLFTAISLWAQNPEKKTILFGNYQREYLLYAPSQTYPANLLTPKYSGVIVAIHGFNSSMDVFFDDYKIQTIADSLNYVIIAPQALPEQDVSVNALATILGIKLDAVWACGLRVKTALFDKELNAKNIDDVAFIGEIIWRTIQDFSIATDNIFLVGTSMGGFMSYQYAMFQPVKVAGIVDIVGTMGLNIKGKDHPIATPMCIFHSVDDEVVPYTGSHTVSGQKVTLGEPLDSVVQYWVRVNGAGAPTSETVANYPSSNGKTVEKTTYPNTDNEVIHYKITGAQHSYFFRKESGDCMDYVEEIGRFIAAHSAPNVDNAEIAPLRFEIYPNPAGDVIYSNLTDGTATVYDLSGRLVLTAQLRSGSLDVSSLKSGAYIVRLSYGNKIYTAKILKK